MSKSKQPNGLPSLLNIPITDLATADETTLHDVCKGKITVIDFWTTKCVKCPAALDKLNSLAISSTHSSLQFISICCDSCDGAREIIEQSADPRWTNMSHYFATVDEKERAKAHFGFKAVPFYVVVDEHGKVVMNGSPAKVDLDLAPGVKISRPALVFDDFDNEDEDEEEKKAEEAPRAFVLDEDF